jgi:hypothetical protein
MITFTCSFQETMLQTQEDVSTSLEAKLSPYAMFDLHLIATRVIPFHIHFHYIPDLISTQEE